MKNEDTRTPGLTDPKEIAEKRKENETSERARIATMRDSSTQAFLNFKLDTEARLNEIEKILKIIPMEKRPVGRPRIEKPSDGDIEVSKD